ncbi:hypothetical protein CEXT_626971 [Caerostris extrusa]|uniref:Uncharacterized protein n=1 Tax=Caerostris extrusa TaxID=172846 RepID=A0AAV4M5N1_CAEEX|nr:hypothetical protein CEXT_626971 [Caerostris extrusa]
MLSDFSLQSVYILGLINFNFRLSFLPPPPVLDRYSPFGELDGIDHIADINVHDCEEIKRDSGQRESADYYWKKVSCGVVAAKKIKGFLHTLFNTAACSMLRVVQEMH